VLVVIVLPVSVSNIREPVEIVLADKVELTVREFVFIVLPVSISNIREPVVIVLADKVE
jgi:hypothetical protein